MIIKRVIGLFCFLFCFRLLTCGQPFSPPINDPWVKEHFARLSLEEKIAQLFMVEVRPAKGANHLTQVERLVKKYQIGGLIFFKGNPKNQALLTNKYQLLSKTKMLIAIDGEWGLAMRLNQTPNFPYQMELGGIQNNKLIFEMGKEIGKQCKRLGIHINLAPVVDINNNPKNPVINFRSFGENPAEVSMKSLHYAKGLQSENIIACAKHFPGHGDTETDSHKDLPIIRHDLSRLNQIELVPFKYLIKNGVASIMSAHLYVPSIESKENTATSLSSKAINQLLRNKLKYKGLVITDALNMQGVAKFYPPGELELKALKAGNDILLAPADVPKSIQQIKNAMKQGRLDTGYVFQKVRKILAYKKWVGLDTFRQIPLQNLTTDLNTPNAKLLIEKLAIESVCLAANKQNFIPIKETTKAQTLFVEFNDFNVSFKNEMSERGLSNHIRVSSRPSDYRLKRLSQEINTYKKIVISLHQLNKYPKNNYGLSKNLEAWIQKTIRTKNSLLVVFGNPYAIKNISDIENLIVAYSNDALHHKVVSQVIVGEILAKAYLPVSINTKLTWGKRAKILSNKKNLKEPSDSLKRVHNSKLKLIDTIANQAIRDKCMPGCQILVAHKGTVVYEKSFGFFTYDSSQIVKKTSLYDLASLTKILGTTLAIMKLNEEEKIQLNDPMSKHLEFLKYSNKADITIKEVLTHRAGLQDWIPFYKHVLENAEILDTVFSNIPSGKFSIKNGNGIYMNKNYVDQMIDEIISSPINGRGKYLYSDLGMILLKQLVEKKSGVNFDYYLESNFYQCLDLERTCFNPTDKFHEHEIVPTEINPDHRPGLIQGFVHDPASAMLGGVSGHAGLFSNAHEVAIIMQMLMNKGQYGSYQFFNEETIEKFIKRQSYDSRRGLGFDKHDFIHPRKSPTSKLASPSTFGHSGFTGTQVWADPSNEIIYVFLSNRIYPTAKNKKLIYQNIRTKIMDEIYKQILN